VRLWGGCRAKRAYFYRFSKFLRQKAASTAPGQDFFVIYQNKEVTEETALRAYKATWLYERAIFTG
jgi:hypothetical protein